VIFFHYVRLRVVFDDFTVECQDGTFFNVDGRGFNLGRDTDFTRYTWGDLRDELEHHAITSDMDIEVKKCKCEVMKVMPRSSLLFPHGIEGQDNLLHIKVVEKGGMVSI
jgi:hypothetical protein